VDSDTQWTMAWISAFLLSIGLGLWQDSWGAGFLCAGFMGFSLVGTSMAASRWHEIVLRFRGERS